MIVLGFDTATPATAVGLALADGSVREERDDPIEGERPGHSTRLLPLAHELLADVGLAWHEVRRIGVGVGPGTFTGLRIGVATARGLAQASGAELCGVSSLAALAAGVGGATGFAEGVLAVVDARRGEVFAAAYGPCDAAGERQELVGADVLAPDRLGELLKAADALGPGRWTAVGDGALRYRETLEELGASLPEASSPLHSISGRAICELAAHAPAAGLTVVPDYLRRPDAELSLGNPRSRVRRASG
jgi:tRNA threonylcarbamoyladenosine biosynthesis protein TsaB